MEGMVYSIGSMFTISKESEKKVFSLKRQIACALSTRESYMFNIDGILRTDLSLLLFCINSNGKKTGTRAYLEYGGIAPYRYLVVKSDLSTSDGQKGISKDEVYKSLFDLKKSDLSMY